MTEDKDIRLQGRRRYEPPRVVRLGATSDGRGLYCLPGSGDQDACAHGNSASGVGGCGVGNSADGDCGCETGNSASGGCYIGNSVV